jgi:ubiquinone/menaquinone biosynthesis C-methylase UbiE
VVARPLLGALAGQLGRPHGVFGRVVVARMLNAGNRAAITGAVEALAPAEGEIVADVGFGGGAGLPLLLARVGVAGRVLGIDISLAMLRRASKRFHRDKARLRLQEGSLTALPLGDASVDGIVCVNAVYFVEDLEAAFGEVARVLAPAGRFVLGVADPAAMSHNPVTGFGEFRVRPVETLVSALTAAGLDVAEHRRVGEGDNAFHLLVARARPV